MKISFAILFLVLVTVAQLGTSNILSKRETQDGTDVTLTESGPLEVILTKNELVFEVCSLNCNGTFLVCYEADSPGQGEGSYFSKQCDTHCGFYVNAPKGEFIHYVAPGVDLDREEICDYVKMEFKELDIRGALFASCRPKIENGIVKLNIVNASSECPINIKNAKIKQAEVVTPNEVVTQAGNSVDSPDDSSAANYVGNIGWIFVLILFCIFLRCTND